MNYKFRSNVISKAQKRFIEDIYDWWDVTLEYVDEKEDPMGHCRKDPDNGKMIIHLSKADGGLFDIANLHECGHLFYEHLFINPLTYTDEIIDLIYKVYNKHVIPNPDMIHIIVNISLDVQINSSILTMAQLKYIKEQGYEFWTAKNLGVKAGLNFEEYFEPVIRKLEFNFSENTPTIQLPENFFNNSDVSSGDGDDENESDNNYEDKKGYDKTKPIKGKLIKDRKFEDKGSGSDQEDNSEDQDQEGQDQNQPKEGKDPNDDKNQKDKKNKGNGEGSEKDQDEQAPPKPQGFDKMRMTFRSLVGGDKMIPSIPGDSPETVEIINFSHAKLDEVLSSIVSELSDRSKLSNPDHVRLYNRKSRGSGSEFYTSRKTVVKNSCPKLGVIIDVSSSMENSIVASVLRTISENWRLFDRKSNVILWNTRLVKEYPIDDIEENIPVGGGTDIGAAVGYCTDYNKILIISDFETDLDKLNHACIDSGAIVYGIGYDVSSYYRHKLDDLKLKKLYIRE